MNTPPAQPPYTPPVSQPQAPLKKRGFLGCGCGGLALLALLCVVGGIGLLEFMRLNSWNSGLAAFGEGDCEVAVENLERVEDFSGVGIAERLSPNFNPERAPGLIDECSAYQTAIAPIASDDYGRAASYLMAFKSDYPDSGLNPVARARIAEWYEEAGAATLADHEFCQALYEGVGLEQLAEIDSEIPALIYQCGQNYVAEEDFENGLVFYALFRENHTDHALAPSVEQSLAEAEIAYADALGAPEISQPTAVGTAPSGQVLWSVRNDSPNRIQIILTGAETLIEEIEVCEDCLEFENAPKDCPGNGPVRDITIPPGDYQVVVKAIGEENVTPYRGTFTFEDATAYDECFFVTTGEGYDPSTDPAVAPAGTPVSPPLESRSTFDLEPGHCFEFPAEATGNVDIVDCSAPHHYEVYAVFDTEGAPDAAYPGDDEMDARGEAECLPYFEPYVGMDYDLSLLFYFTLTPYDVSWAEGDREMVCVLYQPDETGEDDLLLIGSMQGAAR